MKIVQDLYTTHCSHLCHPEIKHLYFSMVHSIEFTGCLVSVIVWLVEISGCSFAVNLGFGLVGNLEVPVLWHFLLIL